MLVRARRAPGEKAGRVFCTDAHCFHMVHYVVPMRPHACTGMSGLAVPGRWWT